MAATRGIWCWIRAGGLTVLRATGSARTSSTTRETTYLTTTRMLSEPSKRPSRRSGSGKRWRTPVGGVPICPMSTGACSRTCRWSNGRWLASTNLRIAIPKIDSIAGATSRPRRSVWTTRRTRRSRAARRPYIVSARVGPAGGRSVLRVATCVRRGGHGDGVERATRTRDHQNAIDATVDRESLVTTRHYHATQVHAGGRV